MSTSKCETGLCPFSLTCIIPGISKKFLIFVNTGIYFHIHGKLEHENSELLLTPFLATWEFVLVSLASGLVNSAFGGLFWVYIGTTLCYSTVVLSLAEMSSMAPTAGGQYHWVSEFAPESCQKFLSYCAGWMSTLGWLASAGGSGFVTATILQSMIAVHNEAFTFASGPYTGIMLAILAITIVFNTWGSTTLPNIEIGSLVGHLAGFVVVVVAVLVMAPKNSASDVFTTFTSSSGWDIRTGCLLTQVTVLYANLGQYHHATS